MNRVRALAVLESAGMSAFILAEPINIYHATGFWPRTLELGHRGSTEAVVSADAARPVALVTAQFLYYFRGASLEPGSGLDAFLYSGADEERAAAPVYFRTTAGAAKTCSNGQPGTGRSRRSKRARRSRQLSRRSPGRTRHRRRCRDRRLYGAGAGQRDARTGVPPR